MTTKLRDCIKEIEKGNDLDKRLPEYVDRAMKIHDSHARLMLMLEYYVFYEMISEGINPYIETAKENTAVLHQVIWDFFADGENFSPAKRQEAEQTLLSLRQEVTEKMQVLTAYVDRFVIYEYVLNRIQYRFEDLEVMPEDSVFAQEVLQFIFSTQDNVTINDNIHAVLGQLPMRMTRKHYLDLVKESILVYKGSDISSLEGHLYMFRTNAMLYQTPAMEKYFTEFIPVLEELAGLDYDNLTGEGYQIYAEKIRVNAAKLNEISDLYMLLEKLINEVYSVVLASPYREEKKHTVSDLVTEGINALFMDRESDVWNRGTGDVPETEEEKLMWLAEYLPKVEGQQEQVYASMSVADAALEEIRQSQKDAICQNGLEQAFTELTKLCALSSGSAFVDLEEKAEEEKVTEARAEKEAEKLAEELQEAFRGQSRMIRRAVMANTLEKMPVFFSTPQEVADYVSQSLHLCDDEAEKYASKQLIRDLMCL